MNGKFTGIGYFVEVKGNGRDEYWITYDGVLWTAVSAEPLFCQNGDTVEVIGRKGNRLIVKPLNMKESSL